MSEGMAMTGMAKQDRMDLEHMATVEAIAARAKAMIADLPDMRPVIEQLVAERAAVLEEEVRRRSAERAKEQSLTA